MSNEALDKAWSVIKDGGGLPCKECGARKMIEMCGGGGRGSGGQPIMAAQCPHVIGFGEVFFGGPLPDPEYP